DSRLGRGPAPSRRRERSEVGSACPWRSRDQLASPAFLFDRAIDRRSSTELMSELAEYAYPTIASALTSITEVSAHVLRLSSNQPRVGMECRIARFYRTVIREQRRCQNFVRLSCLDGRAPRRRYVTRPSRP